MLASMSITGNTANGNASAQPQRSTQVNGASSSLPPHLRRPTSQSTSSASNPYESGSSGTAIISGSSGGWTQVNGNSGAAVSYNAFDPNGQQHTRTRYPSSAETGSRSVSGTSQSTVRPSIASGNSSYNQPPPSPAKKNNGWAKPVRKSPIVIVSFDYMN